jgi:DNA-binding transcriptional ArsR family regulator
MNKIFKALSDPTRRQILELLRDKDRSAGDIAGHFKISKPSISHHLNILKESELVLFEKEGQSIIYSLNTTVFQEAVQWLYEISERGAHDEKK